MRSIPLLSFTPDRFIPIIGSTKIKDTTTGKKISLNEMCLIAQKATGIDHNLNNEIRALKTTVSQLKTENVKQRVKYNLEFEKELERRLSHNKYEIECLIMENESLSRIVKGQV